MTPCWMIRESNPDGGGNMLSESSIIIRRTAALGDALSATVVADRLIELGYAVSMQSHPHCHCILRRHAGLLGVSEPNGYCHCDLDGAYEKDPRRRAKHFHQMWFERAGDQLRARGIDLGKPLNCNPKIRVRQTELAAAKAKFAEYPRPWVFVCPRSDTYACRQVPDGIWCEAARVIEGTNFWIGRHPAPANFIDLHVHHFDNLIVWLAAADLLVSVDTGPMHVAAALGVPVVALGQSSSPELHLSNLSDFITLWPNGLNCLNCQQNVCPINPYQPPCQVFDPAQIAGWVNARLRSIFSEDVSCLMSIYKPDPERINHALEAVLPQVQEVVIVRDQAGVLPAQTIQNGKIRRVISPLHDIGLSRKWNFGARHCNGRYLLFLNPDCYINEGCVQKLLEVAKSHPKTGIVAPLLRYPDGSIYHAGKVRSPGAIGWGHVDHRKFDHTFKDVTMLENVNLACCLIDRRAWFESGCADEEVYLYTEDDRVCLQMRRAGYSVFFTPWATGIHEEGTETRKTDNIIKIMEDSNRSFGAKWRSYFTHNANRLPLGDFSYCQ